MRRPAGARRCARRGRLPCTRPKASRRATPCPPPCRRTRSPSPFATPRSSSAAPTTRRSSRDRPTLERPGHRAATGITSASSTAPPASRFTSRPTRRSPQAGATPACARCSSGCRSRCWRIAARAFQVVEWDRTHRYCGRCGTPTRDKPGERAKECPACGYVAYPRVTPAMMVLVTRGRELLLARAPRFPPGMYSALAGFVEPGETIEDCIHREVREEVGDRGRRHPRTSRASRGRFRIR